MTTVAIDGENFVVDNQVANTGRTVRGVPVDGLLLNSRMINGVFDDLNPQTRGRWAYPDTGEWDAERNVGEFVAAMPVWREHGLDAFTLGVQGGSPQGYSKDQPWDTGGFNADGTLRPEFFERIRRVLSEADRLGFVVILNLFYFGQEGRLRDEEAVKRATYEACEFVLTGGWRNVLIEIANECNLHKHYGHNPLLRSDRIHELIELAQSVEREGRRLLVSSSFAAVEPIVTDEVLRAADWVLLHGNGTPRPDRLAEMVDEVRRHPGFSPKPVMFNEDDHFDFDKDDNHMMAALRARASWGYFDPGSITTSPPQPTIGNYRDGYQAVPIDWTINTDIKRGFFASISQR